MDLQRSYIFVVFIAMLIHEVVFSECDLKTKTHNRLTVDGFQRKERQAPIDPSRMYLPPSADSVAAGGFGDQNIDASNNFGDNAAQGYGEIALVQDASAATATDGGSYGVPAKTADDKNGGELLSTAQNQGPTTGGGGRPDPKRDRALSGGQTGPFGRKSAAADYGRDENPGGSSLIASVNDLQTSPPSENGGGNYGRDEWSGGRGAGVYGPPSPGGAFGSNGPLPSPPRGSDGYGQVDNSYYGQIPSSRGGFDRQSPGASYGPPAPTGSVENGGGDAGRGQSSGPANGGGGGYDRQTSSGAGFDQSLRGTSQVNNYGPTRSQTPPSGGNGYGRGSPDNGQNSYGRPTGSQSPPSGGNGYGRGSPDNGQNSYGRPTGSQSPPSGGNGYGQRSSNNGQNRDGYGQNTPAYGGGGHTRGSPNPTQTSGPNGYAQIDAPGNGSPTQSSGQGSRAGPSSGSRPCHSAGGGNIGRNGLYGSPGTRSSTDSQNKKKHSTVVPKTQYQNSNAPCDGNFEKQGNGLQDTKNNGDFGEPSPNAFSNFAPGSQPNLPNDLNDSKSNFDEPSSNAFSNFAPGSQPNLPNDLNGSISNFDEPSPNAFSNFAPGSQPNLPNDLNDSKSNFDEPSLNAFSNFAPGNQPIALNDLNDSKSNYGEPSPNAFSNFAPGNQPNSYNDVNDSKSNYDEPGSNAFSNFAPGNQLNPPINLNDNSNYGEPGPNAFSNFAPSNQLNPPLNDNNGDFGEPGPNAFSNFAPGNQPNSPTNLNNNNCGTSNHGNNANTRYGPSVFSASNTGY